MKHRSAFLGPVALLAACQFPKHVEHWEAPEVKAHPEALPHRAALLPPRVAVGTLEASGSTQVDELRSTEAAGILSAHLVERAPPDMDLVIEPFVEGGAVGDQAVRNALQGCEALWSGLPSDGDSGMPSLGPQLAFLADRGLPAALVLEAESWEPTSGRSAWGWFTGGLGAYATVGHTSVRLALLDVRTGNVLWASEYVQSATAGWKVRSLNDSEAVTRILDWLVEDYPRSPAEPAVAAASKESP